MNQQAEGDHDPCYLQSESPRLQGNAGLSTATARGYPALPASTGLSLENLPSLSSPSYMPAPFKSQVDNVCHYRLHHGESMQSQMHP
jgi:hypothetical protein